MSRRLIRLQYFYMLMRRNKLAKVGVSDFKTRSPRFNEKVYCVENKSAKYKK